MTPGTTGRDCIIAHWLPALGGRAEPAGYRAPCPVCNGDRRLSIQTSHGRVVWKSHCGCDETLVGRQIAARVDCYTGRTRRKPAKDPELTELALDKSLGTAAKNLGILLLAGWTTRDAVGALKLPRTTRQVALKELAAYSRKRRISGRKPRSG